ncbi:hypothetical protein U973_01645 [Staphylococcus aureus 56864-11]|jgi:uncharacterized protein (DUF488 family)|uniref:DUF488 domain-containing protein n=1 Tax=Staphylococcus TaxID=1279 RepID=UPI0004538D61|nr:MULTISPECIES: DUF488 domain-containing protein [Staphylococcus]EZW68886.1 hypothetical protein U973_01645 [Staphylococcus aureus 56864-11]
MTIFTIGHYNYTLDTFLKMLEQAKITKIIDVRSFPNSKNNPQYNQNEFSVWLKEHNVKYKHISLLGGRRKPSNIVGENLNAGWQNQSFHNYADYTLTKNFKEGINILMKEKENNVVALLCAEHHPSRCHRLIISNWLELHNERVFHIIVNNNDEVTLIPHELGQWGALPIIEDDGEVVYPTTTK